VVGIDLFTESPDIFVMDMHNMTFPNNHFDIVYSSHSLEHSYNLHQVVQEIIRVAKDKAMVAIEVPVQYQTRGADLIDFRNLQNLLDVFKPHIGQVLWTDEQPPNSSLNDHGNAIVRLIFSVCKDSGRLR
jgi:SAM-dependent methyltransferase